MSRCMAHDRGIERARNRSASLRIFPVAAHRRRWSVGRSVVSVTYSLELNTMLFSDHGHGLGQAPSIVRRGAVRPLLHSGRHVERHPTRIETARHDVRGRHVVAAGSSRELRSTKCRTGCYPGGLGFNPRLQQRIQVGHRRRLLVERSVADWITAPFGTGPLGLEHGKAHQRRVDRSDSDKAAWMRHTRCRCGHAFRNVSLTPPYPFSHVAASPS